MVPYRELKVQALHEKKIAVRYGRKLFWYGKKKKKTLNENIYRAFFFSIFLQKIKESYGEKKKQ